MMQAIIEPDFVSQTIISAVHCCIWIWPYRFDEVGPILDIVSHTI